MAEVVGVAGQTHWEAEHWWEPEVGGGEAGTSVSMTLSLEESKIDSSITSMITVGFIVLSNGH